MVRTTRDQPHLRLVVNRDDGFFEDPRRYAQSTSGRTDSTGTAPPLSRSRSTAVDSAIRSFVERALRRYPSVVSQRSAYDTCSSTGRELRYVRSVSDMPHTLPDSKVVSIPFGHSHPPGRSHNARMSEEETRRRRLQLLLRDFGSQKDLAIACGYVSDNYISQLLTPGKSFGPKAARKIERGAGKPKYWLDDESQPVSTPPPVWPFSVDRAIWERLSPAQKREVDSGFRKLVLGAAIEDAAAQPGRKRQG